MSSGDTHLIEDEIDEEGALSHETVLILAIVLGFFLMIVTIFCLFRYRVADRNETITSNVVRKDFKPRNQTLSSSYQVGRHMMDSSVAGESVNNYTQQIKMHRRHEVADDRWHKMRGTRLARLSPRFGSSKKRNRLKTLNNFEYAGANASGFSDKNVSISAREETLFNQYDEYYDGTRSASEETHDFSSIARVKSDFTEKYDDENPMSENPMKSQTLNIPLNNTSDELSPPVRGNFSKIPSPSVTETSMSAFPIQSSDDQAQRHKWFFLTNKVGDNSERSNPFYNPNDKCLTALRRVRLVQGRIPNYDSTMEASYSTSAMPSPQEKNRQFYDLHYKDTRNEQKQKHGGHILFPSPSPTNQGIVEAVDTPFSERDLSTTESNIEVRVRSPIGGQIRTYPGYERRDESKVSSLGLGELPPTLTPGSHRVQSSSFMGSEEFDTTATVPQYGGYEL